MDDGGKILIQELIKKKQENPNIKIQLLIDKSITVIKFDDYYGAALEEYGIEVPTTGVLSILVHEFSKPPKNLAIDGKEAMTGGRNIGVEYFDMDPSYNFHDPMFLLKDRWQKSSRTHLISIGRVGSLRELNFLHGPTFLAFIATSVEETM